MLYQIDKQGFKTVSIDVPADKIFDSAKVGKYQLSTGDGETYTTQLLPFKDAVKDLAAFYCRSANTKYVRFTLVNGEPF